MIAPTFPLLVASSDSTMDLIMKADIVVQLVMLILVGMSVACWVIIIAKYKLINEATRQSQEFLELFWGSRRLDHVYEETANYPDSPIAEVFKAGYVELNKLSSAGNQPGTGGTPLLGATENVERALRRASTVELTSLEHRIPFLATTGSTAPFIGLFGTVWGILMAFNAFAQMEGQPNMDIVGPAISEALIATAIGLAAAIPAVMAYNYFNTRLRVLSSEMENFSSDFLNIVKRHFRTG